MREYEIKVKLIHNDELQDRKITFKEVEENNWSIETNIPFDRETEKKVFDISKINEDTEIFEKSLNNYFNNLKLISYWNSLEESLFDIKYFIKHFFLKIYKNDNKDFINKDGSLKNYSEEHFKEFISAIEEYQNKKIEKFNEISEKYTV